MKITLITLVVMATVLLVGNFRSVKSYPVETTPEPTTTLSEELADSEYPEAEGSEFSSSWTSVAQVGSIWNVTAFSSTPPQENDDSAPEDDDDDDTVAEDSDED